METRDGRAASVAAPFIDYPESDGEPWGETDDHIDAIIHLRLALQYVFRQAEDVYVAANMLLYYEEGDRDARKAPDVFVVQGVRKHKRRTYKMWEEGRPPSLIVEVTSRKTRLEDLGTKKALYEELGVAEYLLFDPLGEYLRPRFQAFRLKSGRYRPKATGTGEAFHSDALGIDLRAEGPLLRVVDPETGRPVPSHLEAAAEAQAQAAEAQAQAAEAQAQQSRAEAAEAELARLRAELEALRLQSGQGPPPGGRSSRPGSRRAR